MTDCKKGGTIGIVFFVLKTEVKNPQIPIDENRFQIGSERSAGFTKQRFFENVLFRFSFSVV